ncbi:MAG: phosphoribosylanthranilate isomerase [Candidatus Sumerlaeaceae bacterium]|nr:phosphoribosylanthranilate isomerase [Candidatus Sumerlaeaceae bacterium]
MRSRPRIKICCISSLEEAHTAIKCGADAVGLVSKMPSGPGVIDENLIAEIARAIPPGVASFLLTSLQDADAIITQHRRLRTNTIQICDRLESGTYDDLRKAMPGVGLVQVVHVSGPESVEEAREVARHVDALLLDSGNQSLAVKELGGTGRTHDWQWSREIREASGKPVYLAGGINGSNVSAAWETVRPFGFDLCSSVRTNGLLDADKLREFMNRASDLG